MSSPCRNRTGHTKTFLSIGPIANQKRKGRAQSQRESNHGAVSSTGDRPLRSGQRTNSVYDESSSVSTMRHANPERRIFGYFSFVCSGKLKVSFFHRSVSKNKIVSHQCERFPEVNSGKHEKRRNHVNLFFFSGLYDLFLYYLFPYNFLFPFSFSLLLLLNGHRKRIALQLKRIDNPFCIHSIYFLSDYLR